jgi:membrane-associated phospholipid phosphatase
MDWVQWIGEYSIGIAFVYGVCSLYYREGRLLGMYVVCMWINNWLNLRLKTVIQDPRPRDVESDKRHSNYYGMPSGHMQHMGYSITYLSLAGAPYIEALWVLGVITAYQRYTSRSHTPTQILAGLGVGTGVGYVAYALSNGR